MWDQAEEQWVALSKGVWSALQASPQWPQPVSMEDIRQQLQEAGFATTPPQKPRGLRALLPQKRQPWVSVSKSKVVEWELGVDKVVGKKITVGFELRVADYLQRMGKWSDQLESRYEKIAYPKRVMVEFELDYEPVTFPPKLMEGAIGYDYHEVFLAYVYLTPAEYEAERQRMLSILQDEMWEVVSTEGEVRVAGPLPRAEAIKAAQSLAIRESEEVVTENTDKGSQRVGIRVGDFSIVGREGQLRSYTTKWRYYVRPVLKTEPDANQATDPAAE